MQLLIGFLLAAVIAWLAWRLGALSPSGGLAATLTGGLIFSLGGIPWAALLLTFFVSSSALSRAFAGRKAALSEKFSKGSRRDWGQVLANGGLGALLAVAHALLPGQAWPWAAFAGAMAAVNADTWATELGVLSPAPPRLVTTWRQVERGASGGVTWLGSLASLGGAAVVSLAACLFPAEGMTPALALFVLLGGAAGSLFDSFLGATFQAIYYCPSCRKETERHPKHLCGSQTTQVRGWRWLDNDLVNFGCSLAGAVITMGLLAPFSPASSIIPFKVPGIKTLEISNNPEVMVILADHNSWPGGNLPGQSCNHIPDLSIWGDGRAVFVTMKNGNREVYSGKIAHEQIMKIITNLDKSKFFDNPPPDSVNEAGTGYQISVNLKNKTYKSFWSEKTDIYTALLDQIDISTLKIFNPEKGLLIVGPYAPNISRYDVPNWPDNYPFSLSDIDPDGKWISGDELQFIWETINAHPEPLTGIEDKGTIFAVALEIEGISTGNPPYDCWKQ
jgi:uncharacterized protein (TIGR00297 family)